MVFPPFPRTRPSAGIGFYPWGRHGPGAIARLGHLASTVLSENTAMHGFGLIAARDNSRNHVSDDRLPSVSPTISLEPKCKPLSSTAALVGGYLRAVAVPGVGQLVRPIQGAAGAEGRHSSA